MKKYQICSHPDMPSNLVLEMEDNAKEVIEGVYLEDGDMSLLKVEIQEHDDNWFENLPEFEG